MRQAGWDVARSWQGGIETGEIPPDQLSAYEAASDECSDSSGWSEANMGLGEDQVRELYRQEVEAHECFMARGLESAEPPSEQRYIDTFRTKDQYYAFLPAFDSLNESAMQEAVADCPPPTWFLNISGL